MLAFAARRFIVAVFLVWVVASLVFLVIHLIPGDPAELLLAQGGVAPDPASVANLREKLGLERPLLVQYGDYLLDLSQLDFGISLVDEHAVSSEIALKETLNNL